MKAGINVSMICLLFLLVFAVGAFADGNETNDNLTANITNADDGNSVVNGSIISNSVHSLSIERLIPDSFRPGEIQFNIQVLNNGTEEEKNIYPLITGKGFSVSNMVPIDRLGPEEKSYIIIMGRAEESGFINLSITLSGQLFYRSITVINPNSTRINNSDEIKDLEAEKKKNVVELSKLSGQLASLDGQYKQLENDILIKKNSDYDVSGISTDDLKKFLRNARSSILQEDSVQAKIDIALASNEYFDLKDRLDSAVLIKKPLSSLLKDNAVLISTIIGALLASFSLFEILKKKKESFSLKIKEIKESKKEGEQKNL
jgi:hypothetical protein